MSVDEKTGKWRKTIEAADTRKALFVAVDDQDMIVGFCMVIPSRDKDLPDHGEMGAIYVHPSLQGHGVGLMLMNAGLEFLRDRGYSKALLWVLKSNEKTIAFYKKHGWAADGAEKNVPKDEAVLNEMRYTTAL